METFHYEVKMHLGVRISSLAELSTLASRYESSILGFTGEYKADLKSLLSVAALELVPGDLFTVIIDGKDEKMALATIEKFFADLE